MCDLTKSQPETDGLPREGRNIEGFMNPRVFTPKEYTVSRTFDLFCFLNERSNQVGISLYVGTVIVIGNFLQSQTFSYKYTI